MTPYRTPGVDALAWPGLSEEHCSACALLGPHRRWFGALSYLCDECRMQWEQERDPGRSHSQAALEAWCRARWTSSPPIPSPPIPKPMRSLAETLSDTTEVLPFWFLPCATLGFVGECHVEVRAQGLVRVRGVLFAPECAPELDLIDLQVGYCSLLPTRGPIPGSLLTVDPREPIAAQLKMAARFEPRVANIGTSITLLVRATHQCTFRGVVLIDPVIGSGLERTLRLEEAYSDAVAARLTENARRIAELEAELERLKAPPEPPAAEPEYEGAWMTATDES